MIHRSLNLLDSAGDNREPEYGGCDRLVVAFLPISRILRLLWLFSPLSKPDRSVEAPENSAYATGEGAAMVLAMMVAEACAPSDRAGVPAGKYSTALSISLRLLAE
jgi:hypothetical protein